MVNMTGTNNFNLKHRIFAATILIKYREISLYLYLKNISSSSLEFTHTERLLTTLIRNHLALLPPNLKLILRNSIA